MTWKDHQFGTYWGKILRKHSTRFWVFREGTEWVFDQLTPEELALLQAEEQPDPCPIRLPDGLSSWYAGLSGTPTYDVVQDSRGYFPKRGKGFLRCRVTDPTGLEVEQWLWLDDAERLTKEGYRVMADYGFYWIDWKPPDKGRPPQRLYPDTSFIYALKDPLTRKVRYVGKANQPQLRYAQHLQDTKNNRAKRAWIVSLHGQGQEPLLEILETVRGKDAHERELWWIAFYQRQRHRLTNSARQHEARRLNDVWTGSLLDSMEHEELTVLEIIRRLRLCKLRENDEFALSTIQEPSQKLGMSAVMMRQYVAFMRLPDTILAELSRDMGLEIIRVVATIATSFSNLEEMAAAWDLIIGLKAPRATALLKASKGNLEWLKAQKLSGKMSQLPSQRSSQNPR